jgi:hypothetical protein
MSGLYVVSIVGASAGVEMPTFYTACPAAISLGFILTAQAG